MGKFVISRREAGLGDAIVSLIPAWKYAQATGRTLIIDWRNSFYVESRFKNGFTALFEAVSEIGSVPVVSDQLGSHFRFPSSILFRGNIRSSIEVVMDRAHQILFRSESPFTLFWKDAQRYELSMLMSGRNLQRKYVLVKTCVSGILPSLEDCRTVLSSLKPLPRIQAKIDAFAARHFDREKVIAVHVRHGNGGNIFAHTKFWKEEDMALQKITEAITRARLELGQDAVIFLCTDSSEVEQALLKSFPGLLTRSKYFRNPGEGELHDKAVIKTIPEASSLGEDALIEMFLLARADILLCYPAGSFFSFYARTIEDRPENQVLIPLAPG